MKRIVLFLVTNLAVMLVLTVTLNVLGVNRFLTAEGLNVDSMRAQASRLDQQVNRLRGTPFYQVRGLLFTPDGVPCTPPPFGKLVAVDIAKRRILWEAPMGMPSADPSPAGAPAAGATRLGSPNLGGAIVTAGGLVFVAGTLDQRIRAFDVESGRELWSAPLPAGGKATPMTYVGADGKQYLVIAAGGDGGDRFGQSDAVVAFRLP